jgi:hypothetical protein
MGNYHFGAIGNKERKESVNFIQSVSDFPLTVFLGRKSPSWGLNRWASCGLRFVPPDDESFSLRGDNKRLVYKGRRRSHRFTILGNNAFEYDVILEREPASNIISLTMEGAENFDFFRQPDFLKEPLLAGSYAVYKKETLLGEGTGKLCHIHRPEIIDARGRRCWGELAVVDNELRITVPERFLSEAVYPVIVDPTIGTTTVGSQTHYDNVDNESYDQLFIEAALAVNRFLLPETLSGTATAYVYVYESDYEGRCKPVLYSDQSGIPLARRSTAEGSFDIAVGGGKSAGWRSTTFKTNTGIANNTYVWFGLFCDWFAPRFDFGAKCYKDFWDHLGNDIPATFPLYDAGNYYNFKLSMYFTYSSAQNYVRTLTQGVTLIDNRKLIGAYTRSAIENVKGTIALSRFAMFPRQCLMTVYNSMTIKGLPTLIRSCLEQVRASMGIFENRGLARLVPETVQADSTAYRSQGFYRKAQEGVRGNDTLYFPVAFLRSLPETAGISEITGHWGAYIRGLRFEAGSLAETSHGGAYYRTQTETVQAHGAVFRGLLIFVRLLTTSLVRDFLLRRFLKSNEKLVLKSGICREITLDSTIH